MEVKDDARVSLLITFTGLYSSCNNNYYTLYTVFFKVNLCIFSFRICYSLLAQPLHHKKTTKAIQDPLPPGN